MRIDYPRAARTGVCRYAPSWRQWLLLFLLGSVVAIATFTVLVIRTTIPSPSEVASAQASIVYWDDGTTEIGHIGQANRISVPLADVPLDTQHAVLAAEDRDFYDHGGFSISGHRPGGVEQRLRREHPGRVDDHAAVREERVPHPAAHLEPQDQGVRSSRSSSSTQDVQGPDPRGLPQHHLLRARRVRHPDGGAGLLRQEPVDSSTVGQARGAGGDHPLARRLRRPRATRQSCRRAGTTCSPGWWRRAGSPRPSATRRSSRRSSRPAAPRGSAAPPATCSRPSAASSSRRGLHRRRRSTPAACGSSRPSTRTPSAPPCRRSKDERPDDRREGRAGGAGLQ